MAIDNDVMVAGLLGLLVKRIKQTEGAERDRLVELAISALILQGDPSFAVLIVPGEDASPIDDLAHAKPAGRA